MKDRRSPGLSMALAQACAGFAPLIETGQLSVPLEVIEEYFTDALCRFLKDPEIQLRNANDTTDGSGLRSFEKLVDSLKPHMSAEGFLHHASGEDLIQMHDDMKRQREFLDFVHSSIYGEKETLISEDDIIEEMFRRRVAKS